MKVKLPYYTSKDYLVLTLVLLPVTLIINSVIFGTKYFSGPWYFTFTTLVSAIAFVLYFILCGSIAVQMKKRFPEESRVGTRLGFIISGLLMTTGLFLLLLFRGYEKIAFLDYRFNERGFIWAYIGLGIVNIFLTFLFEGIARFEDWKANLKETEQLRKSYRQSQLQGLKSQVNPHFLFNSLNSLSSLISEEGDEAEKFLDEMSKVYRYMLRNDEDHLVTLQEELSFLESYLHLLYARYCEGLQVCVEITEQDKGRCLPPLTLQVLIENAFTQNTISRSSPLIIRISSEKDQSIVVRNNIQPRLVTEAMDHESGLDNLVRKYELLNQPRVIIHDSSTERIVRVPLIGKEKEVAV
jgi:two-component system, LytTR family, sensor kinase